MRSKRRLRQRYVGRANDAEIVDPVHEVENEHENAAGVLDTTHTETTDGHIALREKLIKQFEVRYQRNEVHWLHYPQKKKV
jgi:hypothetical protein